MTTEPVVLFFKSRVDPYVRGGRIVRGYDNRVVKRTGPDTKQRTFLFMEPPGDYQTVPPTEAPPKPERKAVEALDPVETAAKVLDWQAERRRKAGKNAPLTSRAGWIGGWAHENKVKVSDADETAVLAEIDRQIKARISSQS